MSYRKFYGDKKKAANTLRLRAQRVQVRNASGISRWRRLFTERSDMSMEWQWRGVQVCRRVCMRVQLSVNVCVTSEKWGQSEKEDPPLHWRSRRWHNRLPWRLRGKEPPANARAVSSIPGSGRPPGGGHGTPSSTLAWRLPWTGEPGGLQSTGPQKSQTWLSD